jgi:hypothetical protein
MLIMDRRLLKNSINMTYSDLQEILILTNNTKKEQPYLESEFPYKATYELMNLAILDASKNGENTISFDFIENDLTLLDNETTLKNFERDTFRIYPSYDSWTEALYNTYYYPKYLAARGFNIEIKDSLKRHGYQSKSYFISW